MKTLLFFLSFISVLAKSEKVNCKSKEKAKEDIRTKLVHLLELEPFREFFSEVPHFFMSTIKYKNAIKESPKVGEEKVEDEKPTLKALTQNVTLDECGCTRKIQSSITVFENQSEKSHFTFLRARRALVFST